MIPLSPPPPPLHQTPPALSPPLSSSSSSSYSTSSRRQSNMVVVATPPTPILRCETKTRNNNNIELPVVDLMADDRTELSNLIVKACEEFGFFKVINHGVPQNVIREMEEQSYQFFAKPLSEKQKAGPPNPYGYGCKNIGSNGDSGEVEYLLLSTNDPLSISQRSRSISDDPIKFSCCVRDYVEAVGELACDILHLMAEGLWVSDTSVFSRLISDIESDSLLRLNHYPPPHVSKHHHHHLHLHKQQQQQQLDNHTPHPNPNPIHHHHQQQMNRVGFGEHTDPQILTILRSNDVGGLQISVEDGVWVPIPPHPTAFFVNVGDVLQALTNGRFVSVRHRAVMNSYKSRMSMAYFGAPPLHARLSPPKELVTQEKPLLYRPFTWAEYKKATYSLRLGDSRLHLFRASSSD